MKNFIRMDLTKYGKTVTYFLQRSNVSGVSISPEHPTVINVLMVGDEEPTPFTFPTVEERNNKLNEILEVEDYDSLFRNSNQFSGEDSNNDSGTAAL